MQHAKPTNEAEKRILKQEPSLLWWVSSSGCRRRMALYLLDAKEQDEPFATDVRRCGNCDVCVSQTVHGGEPGEVLGVNLISTQPFNIAPKRSRQAPIVAHSTLNQREIIGSKLKRWYHKHWRAVVATHDEECFFAITADEWPMSSIQCQRVAHFVNEIKDRWSPYACIRKMIDCSALEQFADEIVEFAILESSRRPPTPPHESTTVEDVVPVTPSIRWLPQNQLTPATTPRTGCRRHQVLTQDRNRDASVKLKEIREELAELEERI
ncbi:hypothetical protein K440DRAFT_646674 [Wilcoxina mikolae CBS 423.85]|nr:hypothetical protein K440DRAFT_646674 [Wilcoxina mikolae CBS 423.85]